MVFKRKILHFNIFCPKAASVLLVTLHFSTKFTDIYIYIYIYI